MPKTVSSKTSFAAATLETNIWNSSKRSCSRWFSYYVILNFN